MANAWDDIRILTQALWPKLNNNMRIVCHQTLKYSHNSMKSQNKYLLSFSFIPLVDLSQFLKILFNMILEIK